MKIKEINSETSYILDPISPKMSTELMSQLTQKYRASSRRRHRYCFHQNPNVDLHDIFICYDKTSYIPPNKHVGKVESLIVLNGALDFFLFNDIGQVYDYRRLSTLESGLPFYLRVPPNTWHGLRAVGDQPCLIKETIAGPYDRSTLKWAEFAPKEESSNEAGFAWYDEVAAECASRKIASPSDELFERVNEVIYRSSRQLVTVNFKQLAPIIDAAKNSPLRRARLCCHNGPEEKLQEMFIVLASGVDIEESMHLKKDESLTVIKGEGCYDFPNEDGSLRETAKLSPYLSDVISDEYFFARINRYVPHKIKVTSDFMLIHEATTGPFVKSDTDYRLVSV
jgi:cupin fold WbuC family metalloprotein